MHAFHVRPDLRPAALRRPAILLRPATLLRRLTLLRLATLLRPVTLLRPLTLLLAVAASPSCSGDPGQDLAAGSRGASRPDTLAVPESAASQEDGGAPRPGTAAETAGAGAITAETGPGTAAGPGPMIHPRPGAGPGAVDGTAAAGAGTSDPADLAPWITDVAFAPPALLYPPLPVLTGLRTGTHADYERMTVEIGEQAGGLPSYRVEYVDRPLIECGSGRQIFPVGDAWLELRLEPAAAHTEAGQPTLGEREVAVDGPLLLRVYRTCNFEGVVTLVMALAEPGPFRVITLADPPRIVVDVQR